MFFVKATISLRGTEGLRALKGTIGTSSNLKDTTIYSPTVSTASAGYSIATSVASRFRVSNLFRVFRTLQNGTRMNVSVIKPYRNLQSVWCTVHGYLLLVSSMRPSCKRTPELINTRPLELRGLGHITLYPIHGLWEGCQTIDAKLAKRASQWER